MAEESSLYFDVDETVLHNYDDEDSGLGELSFSNYIYIDGSNAATQTDNEKKSGHDVMDDDDENEFEDDMQDWDYIPNRPRSQSRRGKSRGRPYGIYPIRPGSASSTATSSCTPVRSRRGRELTVQGMYGRKDRTPNTILKMMERHRESERVRHHTLNEAMKDICEYVPGYDPHVKETKVIQMQRIIAYECFLENTVSHVAGELGLLVKNLNVGTHFITEAMRDKPPGEWFALPPETKHRNYSDGVKQHRQYKMDSAGVGKMKCRREKISSPTVDSTTDNIQIVRVFPLKALNQRVENPILTSSVSTHSFIPIQPLQSQTNDKCTATPVKTIPHTSSSEDFLSGDMESLFDQSLCSEPEHLKAITATFMQQDDLGPTSTYTEDNSGGFDLSSPVRYNHKVFLQSPKSKYKGTWHSPSTSIHETDKFDYLASSEMKSVSPEFILETKPKTSCYGNASPWLSDTVSSSCYSSQLSSSYTTGNVSQDLMLSSYNNTPRKEQKRLSMRSVSPFHIKTEAQDSIVKVQYGNYSSPVGVRNKRKRYTPHRSSLDVYYTCDEDQESSSDNQETDYRRKRKKFSYSNINDEGSTTATFKPVLASNNGDQQGSTLNQLDNRASVSQEKPVRIDLRRTSWMNGFMMFSRLNRKKFIESNPGVHTSHISKMMGHVWRNMSVEDQEPYREKAKLYSKYIRGALDNDFNSTHNSSSGVPSSSTDTDKDEPEKQL